MFFEKYKIAIVRSNSISSDPRVTKVANSLGKINKVLILGWEQKTSLEEGLEKTYKWIEMKCKKDREKLS